MSHTVNWFSIQGPNGRALHKFYAGAFGWKMQPMPGPGDMRMVPRGEDGIPGGIGNSMNGEPNVSVYVSVTDIDTTLATIQRTGGRVAMPKQELPGGMGAVAGFTDPAGNWIGLWMPAKGASAKKASAKKAGAKKASAKKASAKKAGAKKASTKKASAKKAGAKKAGRR
jgi:predicted enzyme related to lactoylglutathione lyase